MKIYIYKSIAVARGCGSMTVHKTLFYYLSKNKRVRADEWAVLIIHWTAGVIHDKTRADERTYTIIIHKGVSRKP